MSYTNTPFIHTTHGRLGKHDKYKHDKFVDFSKKEQTEQLASFVEMVKLADWLAGFSKNGEINRFKHTQLRKYHFFLMLTALAALAGLLGARCLAACLFRSIFLAFLVSSEALTTAVAVGRGWEGTGGEGGIGKTYSSCKRMRPDTRSGLPRMLAPVQLQQPQHARVCPGTLT